VRERQKGMKTVAEEKRKQALIHGDAGVGWTLLSQADLYLQRQECGHRKAHIRLNAMVVH